MKAAALAGLALACLTLGAYAQQGFVYRRHIAGADLEIVGAGYSLRGTAVDCRFRDAAALKAGGLLRRDMERDLPAGKYLVLISCRAFDPNAVPVQIELRLGDTVVVAESARNRYGDVAVTVDAARPWRRISLAVRTSGPLVRIHDVYVSNRLADLDYDRAYKRPVIQLDRVRREMDPHAEPAYVAEPLNCLPNGSFEAGMPTCYWSTLYGSSCSVTPECWDDSVRFDGQRSLRLKLFRMDTTRNRPAALRLMHRVIKLKPNAAYHFRGMFRADAPVDLALSAETAYGPARSAGKAKARIGTEWQSVSMPVKTADDDRGYHLYLSAESPGEATLWIDGLTLTEKPVEAFVPSAAVEVGVHWTAPGKVFHVEEPVRFLLLAKNYETAGEALVTVRRRVVDYFDRTVIDETGPPWRVAAGAAESRSLVLNTGRTGCFRLLIDGEAETAAGKLKLPLQEYVFSVLHRPPDRMHGTLGAYLTLAPDPVSIMSRAGIRRTVTLSCGNSLLEEWRSIEPEPGKFVWWDEAIDLARRHGVHVVANIHTDFPAWALKSTGVETLAGKRFKLPKEAWQQFIERTVAHYKGSIRDWLIIDEPYYCFTPEQYADLLKATYPAAKRGNPHCRILAHGGYYDTWLPALVKAGAVDCFEGVSDYARNRPQGERLKKFRDEHRKFIISVEYGQHMSMYRTIEAPNNPRERRTPVHYTANTESVVAGALRAMCWSGAVGFNRYDARFPGGDFTKLDRHKCMFEYDGALKPPTVAYAVAAQLLDGFRGVEELALNPGLETFHLEDDARFVLVFWTTGGRAVEAALALPEGVKAWDIMGNPLPRPPEPCLVHAAVNYLIGPKSALQATQDLLKSLDLREAVTLEAETRLDKDVGQYVLEARVTNNRRTPVSGLADVDPRQKERVLREFWAAPVALGPIAPGASAVARLGLNAYRGDKPAAGQCDLVFTFDGATARLPIASVYKPGRHEPAGQAADDQEDP